MRVGIDFGTTRTVVAVADQGRYPLAAFDRGDGFVDHVPGLVSWDEAGRLHFGWDAAQRMWEGAPGVRSIKRLLSDAAPDDLLLGGRVSALELLTGFLSQLRRTLTERSNLELGGDEAIEAMVAVPANASSRQRYLTMEGFRRAGFQVLGMVNEPTAAAIDYAHRHLRQVGRNSPKRYVVVYDLGGGTFDTAAVSLVGNRFDLLETEGIARLGGDDFDEVILAAALEQVGLADQPWNEVQRSRLLEACRDAKERLSPQSKRLMLELDGLVDVEGLPEGIVLDASTLYGRCRPLVEPTTDRLVEVLERVRSHGIDPDNTRELGAVYLVGGAVAFPAVVRHLRAAFGRKLKLAPQPHAATAVGLAVAADPEAHVFVREAITRHFGVWREAESGREKVFDPILSKDALPPVDEPVVVHRVYHPAHPIGHLRFLECSRLESGAPSGDVTPWKEILFPYDPDAEGDASALAAQRSDAPSGDEVIETYTYERDGSVTVDIENRTRGHRRHYSLGQLR